MPLAAPTTLFRAGRRLDQVVTSSLSQGRNTFLNHPDRDPEVAGHHPSTANGQPDCRSAKRRCIQSVLHVLAFGDEFGQAGEGQICRMQRPRPVAISIGLALSLSASFGFGFDQMYE